MLQIGCAKAGLLKDKIDGLEWDGIHYEVVSMQGLTITVKHDADSDSTAKTEIKKFLATIPEIQNIYTNIQLVDEKGTIL